MTQTIIGLEKVIEDQGTGVQLSFHVIRQYQVDVLVQRALVTFASFVSQAAWAAGKNQVAAFSVNGLVGLPDGDPVQWGYQQVLAAAAAGASPEWAGAMAVYAEPAEAAE